MNTASPLHDQMTPILRRVADGVISATPEAWTEAVLRVEVRSLPNGMTSMPHMLWSEQNPKEPCSVTEEILLATNELQLLCERNGKPWKALVFRVEQVGNSWRFTSDFEYSA